jgi:hypothetical protein
MTDHEEASQMSNMDLEFRVAAMLGHPHFPYMRENERRANNYPVNREEMLEFIKDRWEQDQKLININNS